MAKRKFSLPWEQDGWHDSGQKLARFTLYYLGHRVHESDFMAKSPVADCMLAADRHRGLRC